jgi:hypothetical protein
MDGTRGIELEPVSKIGFSIAQQCVQILLQAIDIRGTVGILTI